jgi:hypothetical protein
LPKSYARPVARWNAKLFERLRRTTKVGGAEPRE